MSAPVSHYRFDIGEHNGCYFWLLCTNEGARWHNLPTELEALLHTGVEVVEFSLGGEGRWYLRYHDHEGELKRKLSRNLWMEIRQNPNRKLERLVLGPYENSYWVAIDDRRDGYVSFISHETDHDCKITFESLLGVVSEPEIKFFSLSLGGHFAIGANGWNHSSYAPLRDILQNTPESKEGIQDVILSPFSPDEFLIIYGDGTIRHNLPEEIASAIIPFMQPRYSIVSGEAPSAGAELEYIGPVEFSRTAYSAMFTQGWHHRTTPRPQVLGAFKVKMPEDIREDQARYADRHGNEQFFVSAVKRQCRLGDDPNDTVLCDSPACTLCRVLTHSFDVAGHGSRSGQFGRGIYVSQNSAYVNAQTPRQFNTNTKVMLMCRVALGETYYTGGRRYMTSPPDGYDSIESYQDPEDTVVYTNEAIVPEYLIVYRPTNIS